MLNYKYQQTRIARHYVELVQTVTALRIKVDAGCFECKKDLETAKMVRDEFYYAMAYTYQDELAIDIDSYFRNYVRLNQVLIHDKDFIRAEQNLEQLENLSSMDVLKDIKAECLKVEED